VTRGVAPDAFVVVFCFSLFWGFTIPEKWFISGLPDHRFLLKQSSMKLASTFLALVAILFLVSCAGSPDELRARMDRQEDRFSKRQEKWDIRAESFDRRMNQMSDSADARYDRSYSKIMGDSSSDW